MSAASATAIVCVMTYSMLLCALKAVIVVGATSTSIYFGMLYAKDGECDDMGEEVGPATRMGVAGWMLIGLSLWLPLLALLAL